MQKLGLRLERKDGQDGCEMWHAYLHFSTHAHGIENTNVGRYKVAWQIFVFQGCTNSIEMKHTRRSDNKKPMMHALAAA